MPISKKNCYTSFKAIAAKYMAPEDVGSFIQEHAMLVKKLQKENSSLNLERAEAKAGEQLLNKIEQQALQIKKNKLFSMQKKLEIIKYVTETYKDSPIEGINAFLAGAGGDINAMFKGSKGYVEGSMNSLASEVDLQQSKAVGAYYTELKDANVFQEYVSGKLDKHIIDELIALQKNRPLGQSGSQSARKIAEVLNKHSEIWRNKLNEYGAGLEPEFTSILTISHDVPKLELKGSTKAESRQHWINFVKPLLDWDNMIGAETPDEFLSGMFDTLLSGKHLDYENPLSERLTTTLAERMRSKRFLKFKDADSYMKYNKEYGYHNLRESFHYGLMNISSNFALTKRLGVSARHTLLSAIKDIAQLYSRSDDLKAIRAFRNTGPEGIPESSKHLIAEIFGDTKRPVNHALSKWAATLRNIESMAKLGMATISSFSDIHNVAYEAVFQGRNYHQQLFGTVNNLVKNLAGVKSAERRRILNSIGIFSDSIPGLIVERYGMDSSTPGFLSKQLRTFFNINGLRWWADGIRESSAMGLLNYLGQHASEKTSWLGLPEPTRQLLKSYSINKKEWDILLQAGVDTLEGKTFLTIEKLQELGDDLFVDIKKEDFLDNYRRLILDRSNNAAILPGAHERALFRRSTKPGTYDGEFFRMLAQFKSFPVAIINKNLNKMLYAKGGANNAIDAFMNGSADKLGLINTILTMTTIGYASMTIKDYFKGRNPREFSAETLGAAMIQGGALGLYGDLLLSDATKYGGRFTDNFADTPVAGLINDIYSVARSGEDFMPTLVKRGKNHIPYSNLFWTKPIVDYMLLYRLQEELDPGYLRRMERRIERDNKQSFWLQPSDAVK